MSKILLLGICVLAILGNMAMGSVAISVDASRPIGPFNPICREFAQGGESAGPSTSDR